MTFLGAGMEPPSREKRTITCGAHATDEPAAQVVAPLGEAVYCAEQLLENVNKPPETPMKIQRLSTLVCALAACFGAAAAQPLPSVAPAAAGFSPAGLERLDRFFAREIEAKRVPGAV